MGGLEDWQDRESEAESSEALETHLDTWLDGASQALSDPQITRLLAWLLATGRDPFPPSEEQGLRQIADRLHRKHAPRADLREIQHRVLLGTLLLYGDALLGDALRARLGLADGPKERAAFRRWTLSLLRQGTQTLEPKEG